MDPFRFKGVEPRAFAGQVADDEAYARGTLFDLLIVLVYPMPYGLTPVPGRIVPDQQQGRETLGGEACGAPRQEIDRDGTHGTPRDKPEPHLIRLVRPWPPQQPITGQGLGSRSGRRQRQLLQLIRGFGVGPAMLIGLGQAAPPDFIATAQCPRGLWQGPCDQPVASFFLRR
jgi:hypothetical protein